MIATTLTHLMRGVTMNHWQKIERVIFLNGAH